MRPHTFVGRRMRLLTVLSAAMLAPTLAGCDLMVDSSSPRPSRAVATLAPPPSAEPTASDEAPTLRPDPSSRAGPDFLDAADALADLDSYRVAVSTRGLVEPFVPGGSVTMTSTLLQGADPAAEFSMVGVDGFAGGRLRAVVIGDQAWLREGTGQWRKSPGGAADFDAAFTTLSPIDLLGEFEDLSPLVKRVSAEKHNGRATIRYRVSSDDAGAVASGLTAGSVDVWIATTGGYLVGVLIDGTWDLDGTPTPVALKIDVTRVNDAANRVIAPG